MNVHIETDRLIIRPLALTDVEGMYEMDSDPEVLKYVGKKPVLHIDESKAMLENIIGQYTEHGMGRWAVIDKNTGAFLGWAGFKFMKGPINKRSDFIDFGYRLVRKHWGKGYATEAAVASLQHGVKELGYKGIVAMTDVDNAASRRILEKTGFRYIETFAYDAEPYWRNPHEPTTWYELAPEFY